MYIQGCYLQLLQLKSSPADLLNQKQISGLALHLIFHIFSHV